MMEIEMRFTRKIEMKTKIDKIRNQTHRQHLRVKSIERSKLRFYGHVKRMSENRIVRKVFESRTNNKRTKE